MKLAVRKNGNLVMSSFFALHRRVSQLEKEKKVKLTDAPRLGDTDSPIEDVRDIVPKQVIRKGPSHASVLPCRSLRENREMCTALSEFESNSMDDEESPPFLYNIPQGQPGGQVSMHNKPCPAISHRSGGMSDPASHQRNAGEKESVNTFTTHPKIRESLRVRRNPSERLSLNICIPGYDSSTSLCEPDKSEEIHPPRK